MARSHGRLTNPSSGYVSHDHHSNHDGTSNLAVAFILNLVFTIIEIIGGLLTNSIAILSDAVHDFGDTISLGLAWYFDRISHRDPDYRHTYGYRRFSLVGGFITAVFLIFGFSFIMWHAFERLLNPEPVHAPGMIGIAVLGIIFNGAAVLRVRRGTSLTEEMVSWHLLEDLLGWVAVLVGAVIMHYWDLPVMDPLLSIGIGLFVLWNVFKSLRKILSVFLQNSPEGFEPKQFDKSLLKLPGVISHHHTHTWSLDGETHVFTTHLVMAQDTTREEIVTTKTAIKNLLAPHTFGHLAIEIELENEECLLALSGR